MADAEQELRTMVEERVAAVVATDHGHGSVAFDASTAQALTGIHPDG